MKQKDIKHYEIVRRLGAGGSGDTLARISRKLHVRACVPGKD